MVRKSRGLSWTRARKTDDFYVLDLGESRGAVRWSRGTKVRSQFPTTHSPSEVSGVCRVCDPMSYCTQYQLVHGGWWAQSTSEVEVGMQRKMRRCTNGRNTT